MKLSPNVESALWQCGRERVFHSEQCDSTRGCAIRFNDVRVDPPSDAKPFIVCEGKTLDEAGAAAARAFAERLREAAKNLNLWADRIERALAGSP